MVSDTDALTCTGPDAASVREGWTDLGRRLWSRPYRQALAWAGPLVLLAYGFAVTNFTLAGDDWFAVMPEAGLDSQFALMAGRWLMPVIWAATGGNAFVPFFSFALALVLLTLAGALAAAVWGLVRPWAVFSVVALFVVNPLFTDALNTKPAHLSMPLAVVLGALAGWVLLRWRAGYVGRLLLTMALLVLCLASYQPTALVFAAVVVGNEVITLAWGSRPYGPGAWRRGLEVLVVGAAAIAVYLLTVRLSWWITGTDPLAGSAGYSMIGGYPSTPRQIAGTIRFGLRLTGRFWFDGGPLYPLVLKVVSLALVAAGAVAVVAAAGRQGLGGKESRVGRFGKMAWASLLALGSLVLPLAVIFLRKQPPTRASVFTTVGLVVGFWAALLFERVDPGQPRGRTRAAFMVAAALVLVVVLGSAYEINKGYFGLHLSNQRDLANANRMLSVMEQMPQFGEGRQVKVRLVGSVVFAVPDEPFSNAVPGTPAGSIVNCSGLSCRNRLVNMLNLIGGGDRQFVARRPSEDPTVQAVIATMPPWPEAGSIRFLDGVFVVKGS